MHKLLTEKGKKTICYHCGENCNSDKILYENHPFCCSGCKTVYELLSDNALCEYYDLNKNQGIKPPLTNASKYEALSESNIAEELLSFNSDNLAIVTFNIPTIHCTSCIFLLERLDSILKGILSSEVSFLKKEVTVRYNPKLTNLTTIATYLSRVGYAPEISLASSKKAQAGKKDNTLQLQIGVAGFCFANIMALALPSYFDSQNSLSQEMTSFFNILSGVLTLPVIFYSAKDFFIRCWYGLKTRTINMDVPIVIGFVGLAFKSYYDLLTGNGSGYFDSLSGLVFLLLIGRYYQQKTYDSLNFDKDFKDYFPLSVNKKINNEFLPVKISSLEKGDEILVRDGELIPADGILIEKDALIDYSFVTGETLPERLEMGDKVLAGGRNKGKAIRLSLLYGVTDSYLIRIWNGANNSTLKESGSWSSWSRNLSRNFTIGVIIVSFFTGLYWQLHDSSMLILTVTSVLIVACPCVLALTLPFTFGAMHRILGKNGFFLKNAESIEELAKVDTLVFDKTGTLTYLNGGSIRWIGKGLDNVTKCQLKSLTLQSFHPVSKSINSYFTSSKSYEEPTFFNEDSGNGIEGIFNTAKYKVGSYGFVTNRNENRTGTWVTKNDELLGCFNTVSTLRNSSLKLLEKLKNDFRLFLLSGDSNHDMPLFSGFISDENLYFNQKPQDKQEFIESQKKSGHKVLMIGDGLNDGLALRNSDFGVTINDTIFSFSPSSDAILEAVSLSKLGDIISFARSSKTIIYGALIFTICYNSIGLYYAVTGLLTPLVAALLMPLSSITVVVYTQLITRYFAKRNKLNI